MVDEKKNEELNIILDKIEDYSSMREALKVSEKTCGVCFGAVVALILFDTFKYDSNALEIAMEHKGMLIAIVAAALVTYSFRKGYEKKTNNEKDKYNELVGEEIFDLEDFYSDYTRIKKQRSNFKQSNE